MVLARLCATAKLTIQRVTDMRQMKNTPDKKSSLIESQYTLSFAVRFSVIALGGFILFAGFLYLALNRRLGINYFEDISTLSRLQEKFSVILLATGAIQAVIISSIFLVLSLLWAHAVAGPLVRFRRYLNALNGDSSQDDIAFREKDQLHFLAESFKSMQQDRKINRDRFVGGLKRAEGMIQEYEILAKQKNASPAQLTNLLESLRKVYEEMKSLTHRGDRN